MLHFSSSSLSLPLPAMEGSLNGPRNAEPTKFASQNWHELQPQNIRLGEKKTMVFFFRKTLWKEEKQPGWVASAFQCYVGGMEEVRKFRCSCHHCYQPFPATLSARCQGLRLQPEELGHEKWGTAQLLAHLPNICHALVGRSLLFGGLETKNENEVEGISQTIPVKIVEQLSTVSPHPVPLSPNIASRE